MSRHRRTISCATYVKPPVEGEAPPVVAGDIVVEVPRGASCPAEGYALGGVATAPTTLADEAPVAPKGKRKVKVEPVEQPTPVEQPAPTTPVKIKAKAKPRVKRQVIDPPVIDTPAVAAAAAAASAASVDIEELEAQFTKRMRDLRDARDNKKKERIKALVAQAI